MIRRLATLLLVPCRAGTGQDALRPADPTTALLHGLGDDHGLEIDR